MDILFNLRLLRYQVVHLLPNGPYVIVAAPLELPFQLKLRQELKLLARQLILAPEALLYCIDHIPLIKADGLDRVQALE